MNGLSELKDFLFEGDQEPESIIIYSPKINPRLRYVCKFIFNQGLLINFLLVDNETEFLQSKLPKINYSVKSFENALNINPSGLLNENVLNNAVNDFREDVFSIVFYHISTYEEWIGIKKDMHGRFAPDKINEMPVVDFIIQRLKNELQAKNKSLNFPVRKFKFISTIDVDNVFAYKAKPFYRQIGGMLKDLKNLKARLNTVLLGRKDPFDEYELQVELSKKNNTPLIYFFLCRNNTKYDRTIDPNHPEFIKLLQYLKQKNILFGLHPSYDTLVNPLLLGEEKKLISQNSGTDITCSRQHFLRFNIKTTPKELVNAGIKFDFTMGFADKLGFRAGTTLPFFYYDFETESELNLLAVPFAVMDGAFYNYGNKTAERAYSEIMNLANEVKKVSGLFITVIHERSFSDDIASGWKDLYLKLHENLKN